MPGLNYPLERVGPDFQPGDQQKFEQIAPGPDFDYRNFKVGLGLGQGDWTLLLLA